MEVGQTGGVGGGLTPPLESPIVRGTNAFPAYNPEDDPPVGWSRKFKRKMKKKSKKH